MTASLNNMSFFQSFFFVLLSDSLCSVFLVVSSVDFSKEIHIFATDGVGSAELAALISGPQYALRRGPDFQEKSKNGGAEIEERLAPSDGCRKGAGRVGQSDHTERRVDEH